MTTAARLGVVAIAVLSVAGLVAVSFGEPPALSAQTEATATPSPTRPPPSTPTLMIVEVAELVAVQDAQSLATPLAVGVPESVRVDDTVSITTPLPLGVSESVQVSDTVSIATLTPTPTLLTVLVTELVSVQDGPVVGTLTPTLTPVLALVSEVVSVLDAPSFRTATSTPRPSVETRGSVTLPGRARGTAAYRVPLRVTYFHAGTIDVAANVDVMTDEQGAFSLGSVVAGTYDVVVKSPQSLSRVRRGVEAGGPNVDFGALAMGDANDDDFIGILDFSILRSSFGRVAGSAGFTPAADFNADARVNVRDFMLLRESFGRRGPTE